MTSPRLPRRKSLPDPSRRGSLGPLDLDLELPDGCCAFPRRFYLKEKHQESAMLSPTHPGMVLPGINELSTKSTFESRTVMSPAEVRRMVRVNESRASLTQRRKSADHTKHSVLNDEFGRMRLTDTKVVSKPGGNEVDTDGRRFSLPVISRHQAESMKSSLFEKLESTRQSKLFEYIPQKERDKYTDQVFDYKSLLPCGSHRHVESTITSNQSPVKTSGRRSSLSNVDEQRTQPGSCRRASITNERLHKLVNNRRASFAGQERHNHANVRRASCADTQRPQQVAYRRVSYVGDRSTQLVNTDRGFCSEVEATHLNPSHSSSESLPVSDKGTDGEGSSFKEQTQHLTHTGPPKRALERSLSFQHDRGSTPVTGRRRYSVICAPKELHEVPNCKRETDIRRADCCKNDMTCCNVDNEAGMNVVSEDAAFETRVGYTPKPCWCFRCLLMTHMFNTQDERLEMWGNYPCFTRQMNISE